MSSRSRSGGLGLAAVAAMVSASLGGAARAEQFEYEGWQGNWNTTVSLGSTWRAQDPNPKLFKAADGASIGLAGGTGGSSSDANTLNSKAGDRVSTILKMVSDLEIKKDDMGGLVRFKAWYDEALSAERVRYGNMADNYAKGTSLSDSGLETSQQFKGVQLLDAYVYNTFDVANRPLQVRLGRQSLNWGESLFFQGVNQINPIDAPALRRPGAEVKEGMLPIWAIDANANLGAGVSVEGFYQLAWEPTTVEACGTYWSSLDIQASANPGQCNKIVVGSTSSAAAIASGTYAPLNPGKKARSLGEFGMAVRLSADPIDTEFGLYGMNIHSRTPIITGNKGTWGSTAAGVINAQSTKNPLMAHQISTNALLAGKGIVSASAFWEYPEDVQVFGASAATTVLGWSVGSEISVIPNLPVQRNANDLLNGLLNQTGPLASLVTSTPSMGDISGYDRFTKTQFQLNGIKTFGGVAGSAKSTLAAEGAFQWVNVPDYRDGTSVRYGRSFIFGTGSSAGNNTCSGSNNPQADGCRNDGYVTQFSWGYRLRGQLEYPQIFDTAVTFTPSIYFAHDVKGVSADGQLNEGRMAIGLGSRFSLSQQYNLDMNYVYYGDNAKYDPLRDHDFYSLSISASF
ncbi:DUF1302 domain-containing protein [Magnetospirillum sp. 15-1]|uniref:DUF1302 domain-containing protein n=1 Tax=Magnetospirillum sp. 15-1 TaxID=1979370 RepID=UPI000BBC849D|nr:DUF1302 domain-containing protein [Magnetospirillum sp. 15-1]